MKVTIDLGDCGYAIEGSKKEILNEIKKAISRDTTLVRVKICNEIGDPIKADSRMYDAMGQNVPAKPIK